MVHSFASGQRTRTLVFRCMIAIVVCVTVVVSSIAVPAAAVHDDRPSSHFLVTVEPDGSAIVSLTLAHDLADPAQRDAFVSIESDTTIQTTIRDRFTTRMQRVASAAAHETGREMTIADASIDVSRTADNETGIVTMSVNWSDLATHDDGTLIVTEPFTSGFTPQDEFVIRAPPGYEITAATPTPDSQTPRQVSWSAGSSLDEFRVSMAETRESRSPGQPGFHAVLGIVGIIVAIVARALAE